MGFVFSGRKCETQSPSELGLVFSGGNCETLVDLDIVNEAVKTLKRKREEDAADDADETVYRK